MASGERVQSAEGLDAVLSPRSVAVVGASPDPASVGHRLLASIVRHGFPGAVYPIHPRAAEVLGLRAHRSVRDVEGPIDLAIVAVPAAAVRGVVEGCAQKGVRGLVVVTAGFREAGPEGAAAERELGAFVRSKGMRLVGPNCLGVLNADPAVRLHAIFAESSSGGGPVALMTQSGALGIALLDRAAALGLGIGRFVSMGNKLDVSGNDLLLHWEKDPGVRVIAMHLESIGNPRNFLAIARRVGRTKPILLVKGGRTPEGARAAGSHTGAMMDADQLVDALVRQAGVLRVATVEELFDAALALSLAPPARGDRVAVATNSGGPAILLADALPGVRMRLAGLSPEVARAIAPLLPPEATPANPLDLLAGASPASMRAALEALLRDEGSDVVVAIATPLAPDDRPWADAIAAAKAANPAKPLLAVLFGRDAASEGFRRLVAAGVPTYTFPENAAQGLRALGHRLPARKASRPAATHGAGGGDWAPASEALALAKSLGAAVLPARGAASPEEAVAAAEAVGFPVALKGLSPTLVHKTEAGAVRLGLAAAADVRSAAQAMAERMRAAGHEPAGFLVQAMAPPGAELIAGGVRDARYGPIVSAGLGGIYTEALRDVAVRLAPVGRGEAEDMLASLRSSVLLDGVRGEPARDRGAVADFLVALGRALEADPTIAEFEVNPLRVLEDGKGVVAVDARLRRERRLL